MEKFVLNEGEKPHKVIWTDPPEDFKMGGLFGLRFLSKMKPNGMVDCLLIYDYGARQSTRSAVDFPADQFELFFQGVQKRCPLPFHVLDFSQNPDEDMETWERIASGQ